VLWLKRVRLIAHHGFKRRNSFKKLTLPKIGEADVQPDSRLARQEVLGFAQHLESFWPLLAAHTDDAEICECGAGLRIQGQHSAEVSFCFIQLVVLERVLSR